MPRHSGSSIKADRLLTEHGVCSLTDEIVQRLIAGQFGFRRCFSWVFYPGIFAMSSQYFYSLPAFSQHFR
jgi:hypothetical protein